MNQLRVVPIPSERLATIRTSGQDHLDNPLAEWVAHGWEPLRCCLRTSRAGESLALIAYSPFADRSAWSEVGPVFIHLRECAGYDRPGELPDDLRTGPRVLRTYHPDGSIAYEDIISVAPGEDIEPALTNLLSRPHIAWVHVRAQLSQCFTYEVRRAG
jgi:hypothetical protein